MSRITMNNVAAMSVQYVQHSFAHYLDSMRRCGLKNLDIWGALPHYYRPNYASAAEAGQKLAEMRKEIDAGGMRVVMYTPETLNYPYEFSHPDPLVRRRTAEYFDMATDDALTLGTNRVFINSGCGLRDLPREETWAYCRDSIGKICEIAHSKGVQLVLEQLQPYESNLVVTLQDVKRMLQEVNSPALKVCVDLCAMEVMGENLQDYFTELGRPAIQLIHYSDGDPSGHYILGDGNLPLREYISILEQNDYDGIVDLEINDSIYWEDPHTSIARSVEYLRGFLPEN